MWDLWEGKKILLGSLWRKGRRELWQLWEDRRESHLSHVKKNTPTSEWRMWKVPFLSFAEVCRGLTNTGMVRRGGPLPYCWNCRLSSVQAQDSNPSSSWSAYPLMLNCLTALRSAFAATWRAFFEAFSPAHAHPSPYNEYSTPVESHRIIMDRCPAFV